MIPYRDLSVQDPQMKAALLAAVDRVLSHGRLILGPEVQQFEEAMASACQSRYAVGVNSGTDALFLALRALDIGPGDGVITTPLSWIATGNAITMTGAKPVFVDVGRDLNINPDLIEAAITPAVKAIMPVHFTGQLCRITEIVEIAQRHGLAVIEDGAQAFGARYGEKPAGSFGTLGCFSMNPMKMLAGYGEAGVVVMNDPLLRDKIDSLRYAGTINKEDCHRPSLNGRLDTLQAAMIMVALAYLPEKIARRREISRFYAERLSGIVGCPGENPGYFHTYYSYTILCERRDELQAFLAVRGVETKIQHPILLPYHTAYKGSHPCSIPVAEQLVTQILCLPNQENLSWEALQTITDLVVEFYSS
ncbi:MAG: DegT/DnrJ/EryC1/StrS family aminotransferase [Magnetococcales bacterium]|nr:DegT/DnrJ/EryC1/StrS family aminotransferase [Magnetococcales bacterium]